MGFASGASRPRRDIDDDLDIGPDDECMMPAVIDIFTGVAVGQPEGDPPCLVEALRLLSLGYWPVAIYPPDSGHLAAGKAPIGRAWGAVRPTEESLREVWSRHPKASVGLKLGQEAGIIDVEVDDPETGYESVTGLLGGECIETLGWSSARGSHSLFKWDERLLAFPKSIYKLKDFPGVEIRIGDAEKQLQSVCPPSPVTREVGGRVVAGEAREWLDYPLAPIPASLIRALEAAKAEPQPAPEPPKANPFVGAASSSNRPDAEQRALLYLHRCNPAVSGEAGHNQAFKAACKIGPGFNLPSEVAFQLLWRHWNHLCKPPWSERELRHKVEDAYKEEPRRGFLFEQDRHKQQGATAGASAQGGSPPPQGEAEEQHRELQLRSFASLKAVPIEWLAPGRFPLGKLVLLAGPGGLGKSTLTLDTAAKLTRGLPPFDETYEDGDEPDIEGPVSVLLVAAEDDAADTQLPRFLSAGGDPARIHEVEGVRGPDGKIQPFSVVDIEPIRRTLAMRPDVKLIVIDPIAAYVGRAKVDDHRNSELSGILAPLAELAAKSKVTILMIAHFNKSTTASAVHRIMGGAAYVNSVRAAFAVVQDPDDEGRRIMAAPKFNLGPTPRPLAYRIGAISAEDTDAVMGHDAFDDLNDKQRRKMARQLARIRWEGESSMSADDCLTGSTPKSRMGPKPTPKARRLQDCLEFVIKTLGAGEMESKALRTLVVEAGFTSDHMYSDEVKNAPCIRIDGRGYAKDRKKFWSLAPDEEGPVF